MIYSALELRNCSPTELRRIKTWCEQELARQRMLAVQHGTGVYEKSPKGPAVDPLSREAVAVATDQWINMISWLKSLLTTVKKPAKIVSIWRVDPNRTDTTDELYEYLTGKKKTEKTPLYKRIHRHEDTSAEGRSTESEWSTWSSVVWSTDRRADIRSNGRSE